MFPGEQSLCYTQRRTFYLLLNRVITLLSVFICTFTEHPPSIRDVFHKIRGTVVVFIKMTATITIREAVLCLGKGNTRRDTTAEETMCPARSGRLPIGLMRSPS